MNSSPKTCRFDDCDSPARARQMCGKHWQRWRKTATEDELQRPPNTLLEALSRALIQYPLRPTANGCLEWTGSRTKDGTGYGTFNFGTTRYAHRVIYEHINGRILPGHETDHRCLNEACVNPSHLRAVTHKQNSEHRNGAYSNSLTGVRGVTYDRKRRQFRARVKDNYREVHVGRFNTLEEAAEAVTAARRELFTHNDKDRNAA